MADEKQALFPGTLELLVLKTLTIGPLHGYAIVREIQRRSADALTIEEGSLYPALHRMERRGWIDADWGQSDANRRAKYYTLTKTGRAELKTQTASWQRMADAIGQVLEANVGAPETSR
jgi:transcriptional regulator